MKDRIEQLESLVRLAREPSSERRRKLLREVTDLFLEAPQEFTEKESDHFAEITAQVAFDLEMKIRQHLAERLATVDAAPPSLIAKLANDQIEVARPILINSGALRNADLLDIARRRSQEHLVAISMRRKLGRDLTDCLVERGNDTVLVNLAGNRGADLSRKSLKTMVARAGNNEALHEPLVTHRDLPPDLLHEMFWCVSSVLRQYIIETSGNLDEEELDEILEETESWLDSEDFEEALSPPERFIRRKEHLNQLDSWLLVQLLRQGQIPEFIAGFARINRIDLDKARQIIFDPGGEALVVACKAINLDQATFQDLMLLTDNKGNRSPAQIDHLISAYRRITAESAQRAMRFWGARRQAMGTVSPAAATTAPAK